MIKRSFPLITALMIGFFIGAVMATDASLFTKSTAIAQSANDLTTGVEKVAGVVGPAVVTIKTEKIERYRVKRSYYGSPYDEEVFDRFFEEFFGGYPEQERKKHGLGSGVIINDQGYILTNEHVIEDTDKLLVTLPDGREFKGILKGTDPRSDLAVIKIDAPNLPWAKLGNSDNIRTGQWVVAIGNPFGNIMPNPEPTVSVGIISALHRALPQTTSRDSDYNDLIQTDAAINPGNSGGPLVNLDGEVIGINVALFSTTGGYQGIGFAIPINTAKRIVSSLIDGKEIAYGWIGVSGQNLNSQLAQYFGLSASNGVIVTKVFENSPAQRSGIQSGDIITSVDGKEMKNTSTLVHTIGNLPVGKNVAVVVIRNKKMITLPTTVGKRPVFDSEGQIVEVKPEKEPVQSTAQTWRGITVQNIPQELAERLNLGTSDGVMVTKVDTGSPAFESGLRKGDIITAINYVPVRNTTDFHARINEAAQGDCLLQTVRGYIVLKASP